jgi:ribonuclease VapC
VLDSFAVLALLGRESGGEDVKRLLLKAKRGEERVLMTWVNVGEVADIVERRWDRERVYQTIGTLEATEIDIVEVGRELALRAAEIKANHPLAYADAFAAALAVSEGGLLVTGDPEFEQLEDVVTIQWLPRDSNN